MRNAFIALVTIVAIVSLIGNFLMYKRYSSARPLITVNGEVIRRKDLDDRLDYMYSNGILRKMIYRDVIMQAAQQEGVVPTQADVDYAYKALQRSNPGLIESNRKVDPQLSLFMDGLKTNLALNNLRTKGISATDQQVEAFYQTHQKEYTLPEQSQTVIVLASDSVGVETAERMLHNNVAPVVIAGARDLRVVGIDAQVSGRMPPKVSQIILSMKQGDVRDFSIGGQYMVVKVQSVTAQQIPSLDQVRPEVELAVKLANAPSAQQEMSDLMEKAHIVVNTGKYAGAVPSAQSGNDPSSSGP